VAALGSGHHASYADGRSLFDAVARADGEAILSHILGSRERGWALAGRAATLTGVSAETIAAMLPSLAAITMARLAVRSRRGLADILDRIPPLRGGAASNPHADLALILRTRCGIGPYASGRLRHLVRRAPARAAGFAPR